MDKFLLNQNYDLKIELFSILHLLFIVVVLLSILIIIKIKDKLKKLNKFKNKKYRVILATILIINFILRRVSFMYYGVFDYKYDLDLGFCDFTSVLFLIYSITGNKKIYSLCFYMTFIGPLLSILLPSFDITPINYSFYSFLIIHHLIFIFNLVFLYIEDYKYNKKDFIRFIIFLLIYTLIVYMFNTIFNTTYNKPILFINDMIKNTTLIKVLSITDFTPYIAFYLTIIILSMFGKESLKRLNKK